MIRKLVFIVFSKKILAEHYETIGDAIENLLVAIETESELLKNDNLASGKVVKMSTCSTNSYDMGHSEKRYWFVDLAKLSTPISEEGPVEYWGSVNFFADDFVAGATKYPWMPEDISSDDEIPF